MADMSSDQANELLRSVTPPDRRRRYRARVHWPVQFERPEGSDLWISETQDLSSDGFYCRSKAVFSEGELVDCTLEVPTHRRQASGETLRVRCKVRIVRVDEPDSQGFRGIACRIEEYHFPSAQTPTI